MEVTYTKTVATGRDQNDFYPTPPLVTRAILDNEFLPGKVFEPCAGDGDMVRELNRNGYDVLSNEPFVRDAFRPDMSENFLDLDIDSLGCKSLIANPPYKLVNKFIKKALSSKTLQKHVWLVRLHFLESARRYEGVFKDNPPQRVYVFPMRMQVSTWGIEKSPYGGMIPYCWVIWDKVLDADCDTNQGQTLLNWFDPARVAYLQLNPDKCAFKGNMV